MWSTTIRVQSHSDASMALEHVLELARERSCVALRLRDDETCVVARKGADDAFVPELVESAGDRRRRAELRLDDDDVARRGYLPPELPEDGTERVVRVRPTHVVRNDVARPAELVPGLLHAELANVPRDRRLRHAAARASERVEELELRPDPFARDHALDQPLAVRLRERPGLLHRPSIICTGLRA